MLPSRLQTPGRVHADIRVPRLHGGHPGPLAAYVEPHCYDLCSAHADRLTAPRGWEVVRLPVEPVPPESDDLEALANAVREAALPPPGEPVGQGIEVGRRGHLRVLRSSPDSRDRLR